MSHGYESRINVRDLSAKLAHIIFGTPPDSNTVKKQRVLVAAVMGRLYSYWGDDWYKEAWMQ